MDAGDEEHGLSMRDPATGRTVIAVATTTNPLRQRTSIAHELGHVLAGDLDRPADGAPGERTPAEKQADTFARHLQGRKLFINAHPKEMFSEVFLTSLERLRYSMPDLQMVVEIHESAVTNIEQLRGFADRLAGLDIRFAYDDFGAGQARLLELADVPAHFVKFDMSLIRGLHKAGPRKQQVVRDLVQMVLSAGSVPLAEGVESEEEAATCIAMGVQLIQGYLTGRPIPVDAL